MRVTFFAALLLPLTGCGSEQAEAPAGNEVRKINAVNTYHQRLQALPERDRNLALRRGIQDDGGACKRIDAAAYQQDHERMAMWVARCSTYDYAVYVGASGQVQARLCDQAVALRLPSCTALGPRPPRAG